MLFAAVSGLFLSSYATHTKSPQSNLLSSHLHLKKVVYAKAKIDLKVEKVVLEPGKSIGKCLCGGWQAMSRGLGGAAG